MRAKLLLASLLVALLFACNGDSADNETSGQAGQAGPTANVAFLFTLARGNGIVPADVDTFRATGMDGNGAVLFSQTFTKRNRLDLEVPITLQEIRLQFLSNSALRCEGLFGFDLQAGETVQVDNPILDLVAPVGVTGLAASPNPANVEAGQPFDLQVVGQGPNVDVTPFVVFSSTSPNVVFPAQGQAQATAGGPFTINVDYRAPAGNVLVSAGGPNSLVKAFDGAMPDQGVLGQFFGFDPSFQGGARVASADINGDGIPDTVVGAGPGGGPHIRVIDGRSGEEVLSFFAFEPQFQGGVFVAAGDVNDDGRADLIVGAGAGGGPQVRVFDGQNGSQLRDFFAFDASFTGGVTVAAGDVNNDGRTDIITGAGPGGGPQVRVFDGQNASQLQDFFAFDPQFQGGVFVAGGDVNNDGFDDLIVGAGLGAGSGPRVRAFSGSNLQPIHDFFAFDNGFTGGVRVAAGDVNGDGVDDIVAGAGPGGVPSVRVFDGDTGNQLTQVIPFPAGFTGGVFVAANDLRGDQFSTTINGTATAQGPLVLTGTLEDFFHFVGLTACPQNTGIFSLTNNGANPINVVVDSSIPTGLPGRVLEFQEQGTPTALPILTTTIGAGDTIGIEAFFNCSTQNPFTTTVEITGQEGMTVVFQRQFVVNADIGVPQAGDNRLSVLLDQTVGPFAQNTLISLDRIAGGVVTDGAPCFNFHLEGTITIDGQGPFANPNPGGCGFGQLQPTVVR
ncbi:MAG: FG-GAP repeat domain-containing protein [Vulcanimicrobiota bacterium]